MTEDDDLEIRCRKAILRMADDVRDINLKLNHFLENYRDDFFKLFDDKKYDDLY